MLALLAIVLSLAVIVNAQFPGFTWPRSTPEEQNVSSLLLNAALNYATDPILGYSSTYCVSVHRNGVLIGEKYASGWAGGPMNAATRNLVWSTTKGVVSTIIGVLEFRGLLRTTDLVASYIPELSSNPNSRLITIDHILRHESGRYYDFLTDFILSQTQPSQTNFSLTLPQVAPPGTVDQYNQMAFQLLERVVRRVTGQSIVQFAQTNLWDPLQTENRVMWQETSFVLPVSNDPLVYGGLWFSCQDLARFGHLWLNRGVWRGNQLFSLAFYNHALTQYSRPYGLSRRYHWGGGPNFRAEGLGGQFVSFNPEKNLVITRIGDMLSLGFSVGTYIDRVMQSLRDNDQGTWNLEHDLATNGLDKEEIELGEYLSKNYGDLQKAHAKLATVAVNSQ